MNEETMVPVMQDASLGTVIMDPQSDPSFAYRTVDRVILAEAVVPPGMIRHRLNGGEFRIVASKLAGNWPGTEQAVTFAVERLRNGQAVEAVGFFTEEDCRQFLCGKAGQIKEYRVYDQRGVPGTVRRASLGVPSRYVDWMVPEIASTPSST